VAVELIDHMGSDLSIVNAARVSFHKRSDEVGERERGLIGFLMRNRHGTPFEMVQFQFRVRVPIGVAREWQRHRIGSFNEESTRYVEMRPDFYVPPPEAVRVQVGKPGAYTFEPHEDPDGACILMVDAYNAAYAAYETLLERGVAKELARNVLPLGLLTEFIWSVNLRSLLNFLSLRTAPNALLEIRQEAEQVERLVEPIVPAALASWRECGKVAS
jgi:thymidylate synthase (FAD)